MEAVFEAFVAKHLARQLPRPLALKHKPDATTSCVTKAKAGFSSNPTC